MRHQLLLSAERILLTLWVGGLWVSGFVVAPLLFAELESRALAGTLAGAMFSVMSYLGLCCGTALLVLERLLPGECRARRGWNIMIAVMLVLVLLGEFVLTPMIAQLRVEGLTESARFGQLHGLASLMFLINSLLGLVLVIRTRPG